MKSCFELIEEALSFLERGYVHAAKDIWNRLPADFRKAMHDYIFEILASPDELILSVDTIRMRSKFGEFDLSPQTLIRWATNVPKLWQTST